MAESPARTAFAEEALTHLDTLYRGALRLTRAPDSAQDLVQEAYLRALRYQHSYQQGTNMKAWLFAIMRNLFWDRFKGSEEVAHDREQPGFHVGESLVVRDHAQPLLGPLQGLPEGRRQPRRRWRVRPLRQAPRRRRQAGSGRARQARGIGGRRRGRKAAAPAPRGGAAGRRRRLLVQRRRPDPGRADRHRHVPASSGPPAAAEVPL